MKEIKPIRTLHLGLLPLEKADLAGLASSVGDPAVRAYLSSVAGTLNDEAENVLYRTVWMIRQKKQTEPIGFVRFSGEPDRRRAEVELMLNHHDKREKYASEALKAAVDRAFSLDRDKEYIETWLNRSLPEVRILEKAGFERVFEENGLVRYEKERRRLSFLALFMILGTAAGVIVGFFTGNFPITVAAGIAAGILPGALCDAANRKRIDKRSEK